MENIKKWCGPAPELCDVCSGTIAESFVDGLTTRGYWAILCAGCHVICGCGLGEGRGQKYDAVTLLKVGG